MKNDHTNSFACHSLKACFYFDEHALNPIPKGWVRKIMNLTLLSNSRYSMPVLMRLSQYFFIKSSKAKSTFLKKAYLLFSSYFSLKNIVRNNFEHGANPKIQKGVVFHHTGVCITSDVVIETDVHIFRNVTFGSKNGGSPYVKRSAKIGSNSVILGGVIVGQGSIVSPGAVVVKDVPDGKVVAGVPAKIIMDVTDKNYNF